MRYITQILPLKKTLFWWYRWHIFIRLGTFFWDRFKSTKEKRFFWKIFIFLFLYHTFFHSVYNNNKNQKNILYKWLCIAWYMGISYFFLLKKKFHVLSLLSFIPCIKQIFFYTHSFLRNFFTLWCCLFIKKKKELRKCKLQKKWGDCFFFSEIKVIFQQRYFFTNKIFFFKKVLCVEVIV